MTTRTEIYTVFQIARSLLGDCITTIVYNTANNALHVDIEYNNALNLYGIRHNVANRTRQHFISI